MAALYINYQCSYFKIFYGFFKYKLLHFGQDSKTEFVRGMAREAGEDQSESQESGIAQQNTTK